VRKVEIYRKSTGTPKDIDEKEDRVQLRQKRSYQRCNLKPRNVCVVARVKQDSRRSAGSTGNTAVREKHINCKKI
jgi:hypothetical protein